MGEMGRVLDFTIITWKNIDKLLQDTKTFRKVIQACCSLIVYDIYVIVCRVYSVIPARYKVRLKECLHAVFCGDEVTL